MSPGIYLTAAVPISWPALAWSGVLIGGDAARLGGRAAAFLHDLVPKPPDQIEVLVHAIRAAPAVSGVWYFRRGELESDLGPPWIAATVDRG